LCGLEVKVCGSNMEEWIYLVMIAMIGTFSLIGAKMFNPNQAKTKVKSRKENAYETLDKVNEETITRLSKELKKESGRANRLQALKEQAEGIEEEIEETDQKQITFEEITALVDTHAPKYAKMLPLLEKQVMEAVKGMSMEQVLGYVKQFTGNQQPQGGPLAPDAAGNTWRPDYA